MLKNARRKLTLSAQAARAGWLLVACWLALAVPANSAHEVDIEALSLQLFSVQGPAKKEVVERLLATGDKRLISTFVLAMRWTGNNRYVARALSELTGSRIDNWHDAYRWQQRHPQQPSHASLRALKMRFWGNTDPRLAAFFSNQRGDPAAMNIRLEEIVWGGVLVDGIPALNNPTMIAAAQADYLLPDDLVFGVNINGDSRAYPLRILGWHEMLNDVIGGQPVALTYCTLCGAGILYETRLPGHASALEFGTSGLLYRSNKLMYDRTTRSLWNQFTGQPVVGSLAGTGVRLKVVPMVVTSWREWQRQQPATTVLSLQTGFVRNYQSGAAYQAYFASPDLMFPALLDEQSPIARKERVFGVRQLGAAKAWPIAAFRENPVINDSLAGNPLVLIGDAESGAVRAYHRTADIVFEELLVGESLPRLSTQAGDWYVHEAFLVSADGQRRLARLPGHLSYWFAWDNFLGLSSKLYQPPQRALAEH